MDDQFLAIDLAQSKRATRIMYPVSSSFAICRLIYTLIGGALDLYQSYIRDFRIPHRLDILCTSMSARRIYFAET